MSIDYESLLGSFVAESTERLGNAETAILRLETEYDAELVNDVFRAFHTIKGDSGVFGLQSITDTAHALESILEPLRTGQGEELSMDRIDVLLTGIDILRQMILDTTHADAVPVDRFNVMLRAVAEGVPPDTNPILRQEMARDDSGKFHIRIKKRFYKDAERDGEWLFLLYLDLFRQRQGSLLEIRTLLESLEDTGQLLEQGVFQPRRPVPGARLQDYIPYYLLIKTPLEPEAYLARHDLDGRILKVLVKPGANAAPGGAPEVLREQGDAGDAAATAAFGIFEDTLPVMTKTAGPAERIPEQPPVKSGMPETTQAPGGEAGGEKYLKVHIEILNELINLAGETVIARNELLQKMDKNKDPGLVVAGKKINYLVTKLQENIMRTRLQEIGTIFHRLPRLVRDLSLLMGKKVELVTEGGDVELDKTLIDAILDPVMHMVRNSIDHGLETPAERLARGKQETGILRLSANLRGGNVVLAIQDDGRGLDIGKIKATAVRRGLLTDRELEGMDRDAVLKLIFEPGFSTAEVVTQTSGHGVGMDVVRTNFKRIGGTIDIQTEEGAGTIFHITLPQTLSIITCLMVRILDRTYALPQQNIEELLLVDPGQMAMVEDHQMYRLRGHLLPLVETGRVLYPDTVQETPPRYIAVVHTDRHRFGLLIDAIINPEEIVVKPLGEHFSDLILFSGAAILGNGEVILILDVPGIARHINLQQNLDQESETARTKEMVGKDDTGYLIIGVSDYRFALPVNTLPRIEKLAGSQIDTFMDVETFVYEGDIIPLVHLERVYGIREHPFETGNVLIFTVNGLRVGVCANRIHNVVDTIPDLDTGAYYGGSILGQAIIAGEKTVVLDIQDLLSRLQTGRFQELQEKMRKALDTAMEGSHAGTN